VNIHAHPKIEYELACRSKGRNRKHVIIGFQQWMALLALAQAGMSVALSLDERDASINVEPINE